VGLVLAGRLDFELIHHTLGDFTVVLVLFVVALGVVGGVVVGSLDLVQDAGQRPQRLLRDCVEGVAQFSVGFETLVQPHYFVQHETQRLLHAGQFDCERLRVEVGHVVEDQFDLLVQSFALLELLADED